MMDSAAYKEEVKAGRIISSVLYQIDVDKKIIKNINITSSDNDLEDYLSELLKEVNKSEQKRQYEFHRETTEFYTSLTSFSNNNDLNKNESAEGIAERLLEKEVDADSRYGHLGKSDNGHIKKGSFLQFMYREGESISYLGVKIEHQFFLDEDDFRKKIGLAVSKKIYKACKVSFNNNIPSSVFIYDTNSTPAVYWWNTFLEMRPVRDDEFNTTKASKEVIKVVNGLKKKHPIDYTILRNATIAAFKQQGEMKFDDFINNTFLNYEPQDITLKDKMPKIVVRLRALPNKKEFDSKFNLTPSKVPYKESKVTLSPEISISMSEGIEDLNEKIWSERTSTGLKLVVINSPEGFDFFKQKERE